MKLHYLPVLLVLWSSSAASPVYFDNFARTGALTGSLPTISTTGAAWTQHGTNTTDMLLQTNGGTLVFPNNVSAADGRPFTDGSADDREPSLIFTAPANSIVTLSALFSVSGSSGPYSGWLGMGFLNNNAPIPGIFSASGPFMNLSADGSIEALGSFTSGPLVVYDGNPGLGATDVLMKIVYDNRDVNNVTASFFANNSILGVQNFGSGPPAFDHVVLRSYLGGGGTVDNFRLDVQRGRPSVPEQSNVVVLLGAALAVGGCVKRALRQRNY